MKNVWVKNCGNKRDFNITNQVQNAPNINFELHCDIANPLHYSLQATP